MTVDELIFRLNRTHFEERRLVAWLTVAYLMAGCPSIELARRLAGGS